MNAIFLSLGAAVCAASTNLFFRMNTARVNSVSGFLVLFYLSAFVFSLILSPEIFQTQISLNIVALGALVGALNVGMMFLTSLALQTGPAGLTYAFQNASSVFPGLILFALFGIQYGFSCSAWQIAGICLVILGLFIGTINQDNSENKGASLAWLRYAVACLLVQVIALSVIQGRCILFQGDSNLQQQDLWFMPAQFGTALFLQSLILFKDLRKNKKIYKEEVYFGILAGLGYFGGTLLLLLATKYATPGETSVLFPCFAVATIVLCNTWASLLYGEKFQYLSNAICATGVFLSLQG